MTATTHLAALAALLDVDPAARDWCDEHDRAALYHRALAEPRTYDLLHTAVQAEPERSVAAWAVCGVIERGDPAGDARWLELDAATVDERRIELLLELRAVHAGAPVAEADVHRWPDWMQRRLADGSGRADVLALLAAHGRSKRVRRRAGERRRRDVDDRPRHE